MKTLKQHLLEIEHDTVQEITEVVKEWLQEHLNTENYTDLVFWDIPIEKLIEELEQ